MTQIIGSILSERYEVLEVLGTGGMATVFKGKDLLLNRMVAIKVLKTEFNQDEEFVRKFKQESQAAAKLSHPNIVNVFDVGFNGELHYIIMELVTGSTLKDYLIKMQGFMKEDAILNIGLQIASALSEAHSKDIVHRDIKAQNILVNENGAIKVTDFGIARATTTSTLVNTKEIIGSVHYASPEQTRGVYVDARSDIYSLGILLYEMATKRLPFEGESPVSVALQQIKDDLPDMKRFNPSMSDGFKNIIEKMTSKIPSDRYQTTIDLIEDLSALRSNQDYMPTYEKSVSEETMILPNISEGDLMNHKTKKRPAPETEIQVSHQRKSRLNFTLVILAALIMATLFFGVFALNRFKEIFDVPTVTVPHVVGMSTEDAVRTMADVGLIADITERRFSNEVPENHIISQAYLEGEQLKQGFTVSLVVSNGGVQSLVPNLRNQNLVNAQIMIENEEFVVGEITEIFHDLPEGTVVEQSPRSGLQMAKGTEINLVISKGPEVRQYIVPSVRNRTIREAEVTLNQLGLKLGAISYELNDEVEKGRIIDQDLIGVEVPQGTEIAVVVSNGPETIDEDPAEEPVGEPGEEQTDPTIQRTIGYIIETSAFDNDVENVRIELVQGSDTSVVYTKEHSKSEGSEINIGFTVRGLPGEAKIIVYYGSKKVHEQQIQF